jgi:hypothetical protein
LDNAGFDFDNSSELDTEEPSLLSLNEKQEAIVETLRKIVPKYWDTLQQVSFSHARLSQRCFVIQELNHKYGHLKVLLNICIFADLLQVGTFRHVFRMPDKDGNQIATCDCLDSKKTSICLHRELIEQFHHIMPEPVVNGEDPESFLISENHGHLYFSVASKSGSESRQSQKRTIVEYGQMKIWKCKSCVKQQ